MAHLLGSHPRGGRHGVDGLHQPLPPQFSLPPQLLLDPLPRLPSLPYSSRRVAGVVRIATLRGLQRGSARAAAATSADLSALGYLRWAVTALSSQR